MKEVLEEIKEVSIIFGQVLYTIRDILMLVILGTAGIATCSNEVHVLKILLFLVILFLMCIGLRFIHKEYKKLLDTTVERKRFTHLDQNGNPSIHIEDIPEIIEYLYKIEEEGENEPIIK